MKWVPKSHYVRPSRLINVIPDISPYMSPIDKSVISSRSGHREHMRHHGVEEVGNEKIYERPKPVYEPQGMGEDIKRAYEELGG